MRTDSKSGVRSAVINAVESYKSQTGHLPETVDQVGFKTRQVNGQDYGTDWWGINYYKAIPGTGSSVVMFPGPLPFSMNLYDLDGRDWKYLTD